MSVRAVRAWMTPLNVLRAVTYLLGVTFTLYTIYYAYSQFFTQQIRYTNLFLGLGIALFYLHTVLEGQREEGATEGSIRRRIEPLVAVGLAGLAIWSVAYVELHFDRLFYDAPVVGYTTNDLLVGLVLIVLAVDTTRRAFGNTIAAVTLTAVVYAHSLVGPNMPGVFRHTGMSWEQIARDGAIGLTGVYHETLMGIGATWVAIFIMFAGIAKAYGLMDFVLDAGREIGSSLRTGIVQVAVIASMVMGSITGSAAANTATTGSFTIPMLRDQGIRDDFAAAIEAVASAGGQMLPPVMGVAAFLMADIIGVPYVDVIRAGLIPAALFYLSVGVGVHLAVLKFGWTTERTDKFEPRVLLQGLHFAVPLAVLLYTLIVLRYSPLSAGMYTIFTIVGTVALRNLYVDGPSLDTLLATARRTVTGLYRGGVEMAPLVGVLAAMGIIIELLTQTGLAQRVSTLIVGLGGGSLLLVLVLAMLASILFGLGMPTPAAYILVVILVAPGVEAMGIPELTTHMFVFYFAMLSAITPPVAISVAVGSRIAGTSFTRACLQALRIGAPGFAIPFAFVANDGLIQWSFPETVVAFPLVLAGTVALIVATVGYDGRRSLGSLRRTLYGVASFGAMFGVVVHPALQIGAGVAVVVALAVSNSSTPSRFRVSARN
ncbi:TRAP transporter fused permease subunit [Halalkalicoccus tibetensis]|uniref:TRAP transporter permease n=1 Tax=Halalkalicoccus tibetensis TaxID=175632 RepID=A0ABD5V853_9EURY